MTTNEKAVISAIDDEHETRWYVVNTYAGHEGLRKILRSALKQWAFRIPYSVL